VLFSRFLKGSRKLGDQEAKHVVLSVENVGNEESSSAKDAKLSEKPKSTVTQSREQHEAILEKTAKMAADEKAVVDGNPEQAVIISKGSDKPVQALSDVRKILGDVLNFNNGHKVVVITLGAREQQFLCGLIEDLGEWK